MTLVGFFSARSGTSCTPGVCGEGGKPLGYAIEGIKEKKKKEKKFPRVPSFDQERARGSVLDTKTRGRTREEKRREGRGRWGMGYHWVF